MSNARLIKLESTERYKRLLDKDSGSYGIKCGYVILKPGENIGEHTTGEREEVIIVLKGKGEAEIEKDSIFKIEENNVLYIPSQSLHDIKNTSEDSLEYMFVTSKI